MPIPMGRACDGCGCTFSTLPLVHLEGDFCSEECSEKFSGSAEVKPSELQVSGSHYKDMAIQPAEYATKNKFGFLEGNAIKYISRHGKKNGVDDLRKAIHSIELLIEYVYDGE